ncbi:MAG: ARMT1-like domain-containing protein, partial [Candidatus Hydrothermarchaeales archaeon]
MVPMKVGAECVPCLFERAKFECDLVFEDEETKIRMLQEIMEKISTQLAPDMVPAVLGTLRERLIRKKSGIYDPYLDLKKASDEVAQSLLPTADDYYKKSDDNIEALIRIAAVANTMEYGVKGHDFHHSNFASTFQSVLDNDFIYDPKVTGAVEAFDK